MELNNNCANCPHDAQVQAYVDEAEQRFDDFLASLDHADVHHVAQLIARVRQHLNLN